MSSISHRALFYQVQFLYAVLTPEKELFAPEEDQSLSPDFSGTFKEVILHEDVFQKYHFGK